MSFSQNPYGVDISMSGSVYDFSPDAYDNTASVANIQTVVSPNGDVSVLNRNETGQGKIKIYEYSSRLEYKAAVEFTKVTAPRSCA